MSPALSALLSTMPTDLRSQTAGRAVKQIARRILTDELMAIALLEAVGDEHQDERTDEQLTTLLIATLDEARMALENGRAAGGAFIDLMESRLASLNAAALDQFGRLRLASCWKRAGLVAPDALAINPDMSDAFDAEDLFATDGLPDLEAGLDELFDQLSQTADGDMQVLRESLSEILVTIPRDARREFVRFTVNHPNDAHEDLGCAWAFDPDEDVRHGAVDGLFDRMSAGGISPTLVSRLTLLRSWIGETDIRDRVDDLLREAKRLEIGGAQPNSAPKVHRVLASMVDGSGAQSFTIALQSGSARKMAIVLLKQGFGVKDAYVVPCSSATEQKRLIEMMLSDVDAWDVPLDYAKQAFAIGIEEGLRAGCPPAAGLVDVAHELALTDLRPFPSAVTDVVGLMDPGGDIARLSPQAKGRLINASEDWDVQYPMIMESWYEDSDAIADAISSATTPTALKRALCKAIDDRREHWAHVIARSALLLHAAQEPEAKQFAAVALALVDGRPLKKIPVMEMIAEFSLDVWQDENLTGFDSSAGTDAPPFEIVSGPPPGGMPMHEPAPEKAGELTKLLQPVGLTEWWIDGYMMGVCTAPSFVPPSSWVSVLVSIFGAEIEEDRKLQRIFDLLMLRYNGTLASLRTLAGPHLILEDETLLTIWSDGFLTAWDGNLDYWPKAKLGKDDKRARKLLEQAAAWQVDTASFGKAIPEWLRTRFSAQVGIN